jgi:phenylpropionate dioxygenase-like ring-hydroxylating dioxygenase large terminal subunit
MLTEEENRTLVQVGRGTPMGELLRRYWMPIGAVAELDDAPMKPVRLMGEDLVLYRDGQGQYGLVDRHCGHRRADLCNGWIEDRGLRCHYHGWLWDHAGRCLQQPFEEVAHPQARFKDRVRITAYPVEAKAGLLWAYLGPPPAPLVPTWEPFTWANGFVQIVFAEIPCNWFQGQENSIDPVHFEWLHSNWTRTLKGLDGQRSPTHLKVGFDEFEFGFAYRRVMEGQSEKDELWTVGHVPVAELPVHRGAFRVARAHRRRRDLERGLVLRPRPPRDGAVQAGPDSLLVRSDPGCSHGALDHHSRHEPGLRRLDGPGRHRRPHEGTPGRERPRHHHDAQADPGGGRPCRPRRRAQGADP